MSTPAQPPPFTRMPEGEIPWEDGADVIMYIISIIGGLVVMLIALGVRRMRQNERALAAARAAKAARDNPPGVVPKSDLAAVEKVARTVRGDVQPFLDALTRCEVLAGLAKPCTPAAILAMRKALAGKAAWPEDPASAAAAGALLHAQLHAESLPAKGAWPRGVRDACEYAREAVVEAAIRLTRHAFDSSCKGGDVESARALLRLLACLRLGLHSWTDAACLAAMDARVAAEGMPKQRVEAACSACSWMDSTAPSVAAGSVVLVRATIQRRHGAAAAAAARAGSSSFAGKMATVGGKAVRVCESYTCVVSREEAEGGGGTVVGTMEVDVGDVSAPEACAELKFCAPLRPGTYRLRLLVSSLAVLGVEAEAETTIVVEAGAGFDDDGDDLEDY